MMIIQTLFNVCIPNRVEGIIVYKILYILVDSENFKFYNELMISLKSARKHMPNRPICVLTDRDTYELLEKNSKELLSLAEIVCIDVPKNFTQAEKSRYLKVTARQWISGDMLFIDTDTVICRPFPDAVSEKSLGFVLESNLTLSQMPGALARNTRQYCCDLHAEIFSDFYYNSGVIWAADNEIAKSFYKAWEEKWQDTRKHGKHIDQPAFNHITKEYINHIETLEAVWNLQVSFTMITPINHLNKALIIHYFNVKKSPYLLCDPEIRNQPYDSQVITDIIENPTGAFGKCALFALDKESEYFLYSRQYGLLKDMHKKHPRLYQLNENILGFFGALARKIRNVKNRRRSS